MPARMTDLRRSFRDPQELIRECRLAVGVGTVHSDAHGMRHAEGADSFGKDLEQIRTRRHGKSGRTPASPRAAAVDEEVFRLSNLGVPSESYQPVGEIGWGPVLLHDLE